MALDTVTLTLTGDVPFKVFAAAITNFEALVDALSREVGATQVRWVVHDLHIGSTVATVRGESDILEEVERVVRAYGTVGKALQYGEPIPYSGQVVSNAMAITRAIDSTVTAVRFETPLEDMTVFAKAPVPLAETIVKAIGAVEGRVQTLSSRKVLRFTLFDTLHDRAVSCYLREGQEALMRDIWDKRAAVEGVVSREVTTGRPIAVRDISSIRMIERPGRGSYLQARGQVALRPGQPSPEEAIRRLRDAP